MLKLLFKRRIKKNIHKKTLHIDKKNSFLIAVFSRYGDGLIAFKIAKEFANKNPNANFLVVTTHQLLPYAKEFFGENAIAVNKRNPFQLFKTVMKIKKFKPEIGLNPWSFGDEAKYFISFADSFIDFSGFKNWSKEYNLYDRAREYFGLTLPNRNDTCQNLPQNPKIVLFAPFSTDITKSLSIQNANLFLEKLKSDYVNSKIILCGFDFETKQIDNQNVFNFKRSTKSSNDFLNLVKECDIFVGVDAGPLHVATCLNKASLAIFGPTAPETILDSYKNVISYRDDRLAGIFCFVESCKSPICLQKTSQIHKFFNTVILQTQKCPIEA